MDTKRSKWTPGTEIKLVRGEHQMLVSDGRASNSRKFHQRSKVEGEGDNEYDRRPLARLNQQ